MYRQVCEVGKPLAETFTVACSVGGHHDDTRSHNKELSASFLYCCGPEVCQAWLSGLGRAGWDSIIGVQQVCSHVSPMWHTQVCTCT